VTDVTGVTTPDVLTTRSPGSGRDDPPGAGPDEGGGDRPDRSRGPALWQVITLVVALCLLAGIVGWRVGHREPNHPSATSVDVGFLYDMTAHHQQALTIALDYIRNGDDPRLLQMAREIVTYQSSEIGTMNTYLAQWGRVGDEQEKAMGWMQPSIPRSECRSSRPLAASSSTTSSPS
jgi:Domain of unknown function (DUF305)